MRIHILTLFPEMFQSVLETSILGRAVEREQIQIDLINIRDYTQDKHHKTDDYPFGGGAGMVMMADPVFRALESIQADTKTILYPSPRGPVLHQDQVCQLAEAKELVILCGHYEGMDQRVLDHWKIREVSIGDYILTGGELPAMVLIDAISRMIPEVLGNSDAHREESIQSGLLEYPQFTKPREYRGMTVPDVLVSGNHRLIHLWQLDQSLRLTKELRPDLFKDYINQRQQQLTKDERKVLQQILAEEGTNE